MIRDCGGLRDGLLVVGGQITQNGGWLGSLGPPSCLSSKGSEPLQGVVVHRQYVTRGQPALVDEEQCGPEHRVLGLGGLDLLRGSIQLLHVRAGVAEQANGPQMQERRSALGSHELYGGSCCIPCVG